MTLITFLCFLVLKATASEQPWWLQRAENEHSQIIFKNTTVTGQFMLASWSWRDPLAGVWDTSLRVSLANTSFHNGHLQYRDGYGKRVLRVRWHQSPFTNLTWRALFDDTKFPPNSWNLSSDFVNWGYRPFSERTWGFYVGEQVFEARPDVVTIVSPLESALGLWTRRRKRSTPSVAREAQRSASLNLLDLFTGDGILAQVPQLFISLFSMFTNFLPTGRSNDYVRETGFTTEPEAEMVTTAAERSDDTALERITPKL